MTPKEFFDSIDYQQLVFQKEALINATYSPNEDLAESADSLLNLLDLLQDTAAEIFGEEKVFLLEKKADYVLKYRRFWNDDGTYKYDKFLSTKKLFEFVDRNIIPNESEE